jgi:threonine synthase
MSVRTWQRCDDCGNELDELDAAARCPRCGGLLAVQHSGSVSRADFQANESASGVWRYQSLVLPGAVNIVSYPEGNTPLLRRAQLDAWCGVDALQLKHEGMNPTGSFKDRGMTVAMTQAMRIGARAVACASTGNTSASLAAYAALAGIPALTLVPDGNVATGKLAQTLAYGARTLLVAGDFDDCLRLMQQASAELGVYLLNSVNPFRIEGQKTIIFELLQQRQWKSPDWIVVPAGNLGNTAAFGKAIQEALSLGLIDRAPRIAAVQADGARPFAAAFDRGFDRLEPTRANTIATAIRIGDPASYARGVRAIRATNGVVISVSDEEILAAKVAIDRAGVGCEPASAATVAGIRALRTAGTIQQHDDVVGVLTGNILKDAGLLVEMHGPDSPAPALANPPRRIAATLEALVQVLVD